MLCDLPSIRILCAHVFESLPVVVGFTSSESPRPPRPSPYRPGAVTVFTNVAENRAGLFIRQSAGSATGELPHENDIA